MIEDYAYQTVSTTVKMAAERKGKAPTQSLQHANVSSCADTPMNVTHVPKVSCLK
jgi:hypothetical protein